MTGKTGSLTVSRPLTRLAQDEKRAAGGGGGRGQGSPMTTRTHFAFRWAGRDDYMLADGSVKTVQTIVIFEIRIGKHVVRNAKAGVTDSMLLGFSVLRSIGPFMIDTRNNELVFVTVEARADTDKQSDASPVAPPPAPSFEEFWPEGTRPSKECIGEITKSKDANAITQKCKEEGERWATQLQKNMKNPAFEKQITDIFERN
jgi:hypothetical protein